MDLSALDIGPKEARAKLDEYVAQLAADRTAEDAAILAGYRAASRGRPVISLPRTIAAGGFHDNGLPKLAVTRATAVSCFCWWDGTSLVFADRADWRVNRGALVNDHSVRVRVAADDLPVNARRSHWNAGEAVIPLVPPAHRPGWRRLKNCHILWEAEWKPVPPVDPALIRHLRGDLWAVLSVWDLTELERTVLSQRLSAR